ncbi:MAG TPA: hypothetical protein DEF88_12675, partial [Porphyromonadaceae bacterium]|nr:hypothetical protein [Porphyromonadaceae bacterium]
VSQDIKEENDDNLANFSVDTLKNRLDEAVKKEEYEQATRLRDEINRRQNNRS